MTLVLPTGLSVPGSAADVVLPRVADSESRLPRAEQIAPDIVDEWGRGSFPASDPPANW